LLIALLTCRLIFSQQYEIGCMEADFVDSCRKARVIEALVFYPADTSGSGVPVAMPVHDGFPVIVFGHGYQLSVDAYRNIWEHLVPEGCVVVLPQSASGMFPSHLEFGMDLAFVLDEMIRLSGDPASVFSGRLLPYGCLMGHSMGGGAAILGALHSEAIKGLVVLAPLDTRPSSAEAAKEVSLPTLVFAGSDDYITPPEKHQLPIYESLQSSQKAYISILGGSHCQMADENRLCNFAESSCIRKPGISREEQHAILNRYIMPWLKFSLYNDTAACREIHMQMASDTTISYLGKGIPGNGQ
jgi:dienelactone hydrolase